MRHDLKPDNVNQINLDLALSSLCMIFDLAMSLALCGQQIFFFFKCARVYQIENLSTDTTLIEIFGVAK